LSQTVRVKIEGKDFDLEDREYKGIELKKLASVPVTANLVREESDGSETGVRDEENIRPKPGQNFYHSPKHRRG
jgi:hypothetical protein